MQKYLTLYETQADYDAGDRQYPNVSYIKATDEVVWQKTPDYSKEYLTFVALEDGTFKFSGNTVNYSLDDGQTWTELASNTDSPTIAVGQKIMWKGELRPNLFSGIGTFSSTGQFTAEGNPMSLLFGDDFIGQTSLAGKNYAFRNLFKGATGLTSAESLSLPATTLAEGCYYGLFFGCTSLTTGPQLPAETLASACYCEMFAYCRSLTTAPQLPAETLVSGCYNSLFQGCSSLTTAPQLPATTLAEDCYRNLFEGCTSLTTAPQLPAETLAKLCYYEMFQNCTSLVAAPQLPATTLAEGCYGEMFRYCTSLNSITCLATDISAANCLTSWTRGVASTGTFTKAASMTSWSSGNDGIPTGWTVVDAPSS